ncbi:chorismate transformation enzyme, FkbO/Hyg5 family [Lysobacter humi (ex Lee et al. 2017)]
MALPQAQVAPMLSVQYVHAPLDAVLADERVLAVIGFGERAMGADPRALRVALAPRGEAPLEVWRGVGPVEAGCVDGVAHAHDGALLFASMDVPEVGGDICGAAEHAYAALVRRTRELGYPHLLRVWNYLDDITLGEGDDERYKRFCVGRARGLGPDFAARTLPAATAIGRVQGTGTLQVYWLAAREPGLPLENPRQVSAYRYPRQYGPQPPSFARAMLAPGDVPLLLSGTAAICGHESRHAGDVLAQLDETLANIDALVGVARRHRAFAASLGVASPLKAYVRDADELATVDEALAARLPLVPRLVLQARVCRRELRLEIDGCHG